MTAEFKLRHHNRLEFPHNHVIICEDDIFHQAEFMNKMSNLFDRQGKVKVSIVPDSHTAALLIQHNLPINLLILDHDLILGNGSDLIIYLKLIKSKVPILTASGWEPNNEIYKAILADYAGEYVISLKKDVIAGKNDDFILKHIYV